MSANCTDNHLCLAICESPNFSTETTKPNVESPRPNGALLKKGRYRQLTLRILTTTFSDLSIQ